MGRFFINILCCTAILWAASLATVVADDKPLILGTSKSGWLPHIAQQKNFFKEEGANVRIVSVQSGVEAGAKLIDRSIDIGTMSEFAFVSRAFSKPDLCIIGTISYIYDVYMVSKSAKAMNDADALKGKRFGLKLDSISKFFLAKHLELKGLSVDDVTIVGLDVADLATALEEDKVDAIVNWEPQASQVSEYLASKNQKSNVLALQKGQPYFFLLVSHKSVIKDRPEDLRKILSSLVKATNWIAENEDATIDAISQAIGSKSDDMRRLWDGHLIDLGLPQDIVHIMEEEANWRIESGLNQGAIPNFLDYVCPAPLKDVDPDRVSVIH